MEERLQKILAKAGICSRRAAEDFIRQGRVYVDGRPITEMGHKFDPDTHRITVDGHPLQLAEKKITVLLNKPKGYVTTMSDPQGRPIVSSLVKAVGLRLFPVGRLDIDTEGALLMTNDGELAQHLLHPKFEINRTYQAVIRGLISQETIKNLEHGILLDGQQTWPAKISIHHTSEKTTTVQCVIHEGRKRQVRRMFETVGHPVIALKRLAYGNLRLGTLPLGAYRLLSTKDLERLFSPPNLKKISHPK
ncbi:MAG: rRNA pseudouridine synthase [Proteobacteria bacterium]|nr:rRNA pseudouridine synthase [Desulfobulbaceae bacterium]MBU4153457.1 rRNA pseudouridine synthase [Pseudomonadota bacterium]MDP2105919.1 pseudouridine synthase [Desulfobulbaceae bacterium]